MTSKPARYKSSNEGCEKIMDSREQSTSTKSSPTEDVNNKYINQAFEDDQHSPSCDIKHSINTKHCYSNENDFISECGLFSYKPHFMQACANLSCFTASYSFAALLTQTLSAYLTSQITSIEKQFGFNSAQIGIILSGNDIGFLTIVLFVSHFARRTHIPRFLGASTFLFGLSGLICSLIYFINHKPKLVTKETFNFINGSSYPAEIDLCNSTSNSNSSTMNCLGKSDENFSNQTHKAFILFMLGMMIQGIAKSPRSSLITAFIDNNVKDKTKTGAYMGIIVTMSIFGPSLAFLLGGIFSKLPVDLKDIGMTPKDPRWIGAWWMGFVTFGLGSLIFSVPLLFFPKNFQKQSIEYHEDESLLCKVKAFPKSLWRLMKSPVYVLSLLAVCILLFGISGLITFTPKYIEHQFTTPAWKTNVILGIEKVIGASTGTLLGGIFTSRMKLSRQGCLKLKVVITFLSAAMEGLSFIFGCPKLVINNTPITFPDTMVPNITASQRCGLSCNCTDEYLPVCGSDGLNYFSPCAAGCTSSNNSMYFSCLCIGQNETAVSGLCDTDCPYLYPYVGVDLLKSFIGTFAIIPGYMILLRSVLEEDKAIAIGMMSFSTSFIGWMFGPIIFGMLLDMTCIQWASHCGIKSECQLYDLDEMRFKIHGTLVSTRLLCAIVLVLALIVAYYEEKNGKVINAKESQDTSETPPEHYNVISDGRINQISAKDAIDYSDVDDVKNININCSPGDIHQP